MKVVGRYHIGARIGEGAMANVYRAYDPGIDRTLAIKVLKREYCRNPQFAARFLREAKAAGALSHPNIVTIYDVGEIQGFPYIAMEWLEGAPLDRVAERKGRFSPAAVIEIGCQLAEALAYAHAQGVVHRDVKPSNIILGSDGHTAKLLDFGIARLEQDAEAGGADNVQTHVGQVLGTPRYMSPEQALGRELDGRSDLFSIGVVLYELLTGRPAFNGASPATLALQITQQDPPPIDTPDCPRGLVFIVEKLLSKRPEKRFSSAVLVALKRERAALAAAQTDTPRRLSLPIKWTILTTAVTALVLVGGMSLVLQRQYAAMERVAVASGSSIVSFVSRNAALAAAENLTLPEEARDWVPTQAFVTTAAADPSISQMLVVDNKGVIRAASSPDIVGAQYSAPTGRRVVRDRPDISVTTVEASDGTRSFRFAQPIEYAGRGVGFVDVSIRRTELDSAAFLTRALLIGVSLLTLALVAIMSLGAGRLILHPIGRLKAAFKDVADGNLDFRISHRRHDEFGDLFDAFNAFATAAQKRLEGVSEPVKAPLNLDATMIMPPANEDSKAVGAQLRAVP